MEGQSYGKVLSPREGDIVLQVGDSFPLVFFLHPSLLWLPEQHKHTFTIMMICLSNDFS